MKFCIFCGNLPSEKNKEHVLPHWLIELTGDPKRAARFGFNMQPGSDGSFREFAFDQFTFPACQSCNTAHSKLESDAKSIMNKLLNRQGTTAQELSRFLDWFDKVRVGLWLGFHQLNKNHLAVKPQFHIQRRIGQFDRLLVIERYGTTNTRLNFAGADSPAFGHMPSAFSLIVNDLYFTNVSYMHLLSRRLGFPYPSTVSLVPDREGMLCELQPGRRRFMRPIIQRELPKYSVVLYQPMFPLGLANTPPAPELYDDEFVRHHSLDFENGVGSVFIEFPNTKARKLDMSELVLIDPQAIYETEERLIRGVISVCDWQDWLIKIDLDLGKLSREQRRYVRLKQSVALRVNRVLRDHQASLLMKFGYTKYGV